MSPKRLFIAFSLVYFTIAAGLGLVAKFYFGRGNPSFGAAAVAGALYAALRGAMVIRKALRAPSPNE